MRVVAPTSVKAGRSSASVLGRRPLPDDDVQAAVLERRIEDLLHSGREAVDLVHEQHIPFIERSEDGCEVTLAVERRACHRAQPDAELGADDVCKARLAEAGRAGQQDVLESLTAAACSFERDRELLADALLADELVERPRAKRALELLVALALEHRRDEPLTHAACLSARRTRSSGGNAGSMSASTDSASTTV